MKKYTAVCVALLVALNVFMFLKFSEMRQNNIVLSRESNEMDIEGLSSKIGMLKSDQLLMAGSSGMKIDAQTLLFDDRNKEMILYDLCEGNKKFVFRYSYLNCGSCVDALIPYVKSLSNKIGKDNVIFITTYTNSRDLHVFKRVNQIKEHIYNVESLSIPLDNQNLPYCFVLEKDNTISHLFVPRKEMLIHAEQYFDIIKNYFTQPN